MTPAKQPTSAKKQPESNSRLHPITFCPTCGEAIPAKALACFKCGTKNASGEKPLAVIFCEKCGGDYPVKALVCFHCGHQNQHHPLVSGPGGA